MIRYFLRRTLWACVLFLAVTLVTFQGVVVFATLCVIVFNLVVDTLYAWVDPRIRLS